MIKKKILKNLIYLSGCAEEFEIFQNNQNSILHTLQEIKSIQLEIEQKMMVQNKYFSENHYNTYFIWGGLLIIGIITIYFFFGPGPGGGGSADVINKNISEMGETILRSINEHTDITGSLVDTVQTNQQIFTDTLDIRDEIFESIFEELKHLHKLFRVVCDIRAGRSTTPGLYDSVTPRATESSAEH